MNLSGSVLRPCLGLLPLLLLGSLLQAETATDLSMGEGFRDPLGFHDPQPVFSWKLPEGVIRQSAYRLQVQSERVEWDSGWVESDRSVFVSSEAGPFQSREQVRWRVDYRDQDGETRGWSPWARFEMGLLSHAEWQAQWIRPASGHDRSIEDVAWLRKHFEIDKPVRQARLYVTARGLFEVTINGERVGDDYFANGWTAYRKRLDTVTYDVTGHVHQGANTLQSLLGTGWFAGKLTWGRLKFVYGDHPELLLQLEIHFEDGSQQRVCSDGSWEGTYDGPILAASIYDGCQVDARREPSNWAPVVAHGDITAPAPQEEFKKEKRWAKQVLEANPGPVRLTPKPMPRVRAIMVREAIAIIKRGPGTYIFDFGQNMSGIPRLRLLMQPGQTVTMNFGEMLDQDGNLFTRSYGAAKSENSYTAAESGIVEWEPVFTFHGFRYVQLSGLGETEPDPDWCRAVVLHTDFEHIGQFSCSHPLLNQLQNNIVWSQRSNFLEIPTDGRCAGSSWLSHHADAGRSGRRPGGCGRPVGSGRAGPPRPRAGSAGCVPRRRPPGRSGAPPRARCG